MVCVAFVMDVCAKRIVGYLVSRNPTETFVLAAPEQALHAHRLTDSLFHCGNRGSVLVSIRYTERPAEAGIEPFVGSVGESNDYAHTDSLIGPFKMKVIPGSGHGSPSRPSNTRHSNGSTGSSTRACTDQSAVSRLRKRERITSWPSKTSR
jgi:transposase InsO family protein